MTEFRGGPGRYGRLRLSNSSRADRGDTGDWPFRASGARGRWFRRECSVARLSLARLLSSRGRRSSSSSSSSGGGGGGGGSRRSSSRRSRRSRRSRSSSSDQRRLQTDGSWALCGARGISGVAPGILERGGTLGGTLGAPPRCTEGPKIRARVEDGRPVRDGCGFAHRRIWGGVGRVGARGGSRQLPRDSLPRTCVPTQLM